MEIPGRGSHRSPDLRSASGVIVLLCALCVLAGPAEGQALGETSPEGGTLLLIRGRLVDPLTASIEPASLLIREGRVAERGSFDGKALVSAHPEVDRVDLEGRYLLPGLVDLRVHGGAQRSPGHVDELGAEGTSKLLAAAGVTSYVDLHMLEEARPWRARQARTGSKSSRLAVGFPILTVRGGRGADLPTARFVSSPAEVDSVLEEIAPYQGPRLSQAISVVYDSRPGGRRLSREVLAHLMASMRQRNLPIVVEVGTWRDVEEALGEGARILCHLPEGEVPESTLALVRRARPRWIPTIAVGADFVDLLTDEALRADPLLRSVAPSELIEDYPQVRIPQTSFADARGRRRDAYACLVALDEAGVRWLAGSDAGSVGTFFGWSLQRELWHWSQAGLSTAKILRAATVDAALVIGQHYGTRTGNLADFVVVDTDPLEELDTLRNPRGLVLRGRWVEAPALLSTVTRQLSEQMPENPIPFGGRLGLLILVVAGFAVLLTIRALIRRAAREEESA